MSTVDIDTEQEKDGWLSTYKKEARGDRIRWNSKTQTNSGKTLYEQVEEMMDVVRL